MRPSEVIKELTNRIKAGLTRVIILEGSPGIGKTSIPMQVAKSLGMGVNVLHAPLMQPEDWGMPVISPDRNSVNFVVSADKFPLEGSNWPDQGILVIDEVAQCDNATQKIIANFLQTRTIHEKRIKPGWTLVATGNKTTDRAGANRLLSHLSNRITRVDLDVNLDDWVNWALENQVKTEVIAFIRFRPDLLNAFNSQLEVNATPRAWVEGVSADLGIISPANEFEFFKGAVGEGPAAEFIGFLKVYRELPTLETILLNPDKAEIPQSPATQYAVCGMLAHNTTKDNFARVMSYVKRLPREFTILYMRDVHKKCPAVMQTREFIQWASTDGHNLLF